MDYKLKPYPSGFLGNPNITQTVKVEDKSKIDHVNMFFNNVSNSKVSPHSSSLEVNNVFEEFFGHSEIDVFEFNESLIKVALKAFGTHTLFDWLSNQHINLEYTYINHKFVDETILFIYYGKPREMSFVNWRSLLVGDRVEAVTKQYTDVQRKLFNEYPESFTITSLIRLWLSREGGNVDLLNSLMVLFGRRN